MILQFYADYRYYCIEQRQRDLVALWDYKTYFMNYSV